MKNTNGGMQILGWLTILFIYLKLMGCITWSWFWVLSPFIFEIVISIAIIITVIIIIIYRGIK